MHARSTDWRIPHAVGAPKFEAKAIGPLKRTIPRAARAALFASLTFYLAEQITHNRDLTLFAGYACLSNLLFTEFGGALKVRALQAVQLASIGLVLALLGTVTTLNVWTSFLFMAGVSGAALSLGIAKPSLAKSATPILIAAILPLTSRSGVAHFGERGVAWAIGGGIAILATTCAWPSRVDSKGEEPTIRESYLELRGKLRERKLDDFRGPFQTGLALGAAVAISDLLKIDHAFWVVMGALAALCTTLVQTERKAVRVIAGTIVGIGVAEGLIFLGEPFLWASLPVAIFVTALVAAQSLIAAQAGFTIILIVISCVTGSVDLGVGLVRAENIGLGIGVSLVVSGLMWTRPKAVREPVPT